MINYEKNLYKYKGKSELSEEEIFKKIAIEYISIDEEFCLYNYSNIIILGALYSIKSLLEIAEDLRVNYNIIKSSCDCIYPRTGKKRSKEEAACEYLRLRDLLDDIVPEFKAMITSIAKKARNSVVIGIIIKFVLLVWALSFALVIRKNILVVLVFLGILGVIAFFSIKKSFRKLNFTKKRIEIYNKLVNQEIDKINVIINKCKM